MRPRWGGLESLGPTVRSLRISDETLDLPVAGESKRPGAVLLRDSGEGTFSPTARLACLTCRAEVLVPFSYKSRGVCPS